MNESLRILFIINPKSGVNNKKQIIDYINDYLENKNIHYKIIQTEYANHAETIVKENINNFDKIVAVGGDGTVNEIARALIGSKTALGIIPCGSGNGLARDLQIPIKTKSAIRTIIDGEIKQIDYGIINGHPFFCTCGTGFDASVSLKFSSSNRRGLITYIEKTLLEWLDYKPIEYTITIDNNPPQKTKAFLIACANATQYGNNAFIAPEADISDGFMNVTILEPFSIIDIPELVVQLFTKTINQNSCIKTIKCKKFKLESNQENPSHYDGDPIILDKKIYVEIINKGLNIIVPQKADLRKRFRYTMSQRYNIALDDIKNLSLYIDNINENVSQHITEKNQEVLDIIKKTNDNMIKKIKDMLERI